MAPRPASVLTTPSMHSMVVGKNLNNLVVHSETYKDSCQHDRFSFCPSPPMPHRRQKDSQHALGLQNKPTLEDQSVKTLEQSLARDCRMSVRVEAPPELLLQSQRCARSSGASQQPNLHPDNVGYHDQKIVKRYHAEPLPRGCDIQLPSHVIRTGFILRSPDCIGINTVRGQVARTNSRRRCI